MEALTKRPAIAGIIKLEPMGEILSGVSEGMEDGNVRYGAREQFLGKEKERALWGVSGFSWQPHPHE